VRQWATSKESPDVPGGGLQSDPMRHTRRTRQPNAIAGFQLADIAFGVLVRNGILPKSDAERLLTQAIAGNRSMNHQAAAELLGIDLQNLSEFQPAARR